jgi:Ca2+:H+ antiporter
VELIIFIIALVKNQIRIVQASLIGSILANLLLILGMAFFIGGLQYQEQVYDSLVTQMSAALLALSVLSLLVPTAFHASFNNFDLADAAVLKLSRGTSVILLIIYVLYLLFQLKSHSYIYKGVPQHIIDEESAPGFLARFDSTSSSAGSTSSMSSNPGSKRRRLRAKLGRRRHEQTEIRPEHEGESSDRPAKASTEDDNGNTVENTDSAAGPAERPPGVESVTAAGSARPRTMPLGFSFHPPPVFRAPSEPIPPKQSRSNSMPHHLRRFQSHPGKSKGALEFAHPKPVTNSTEAQIKALEVSTEPPISQTASILLLLASTGLIALCAEFLVGSIEHLVENSPLSEAFVGLIILPIVGNAAEHITAVTVAAKNKVDLALGVALGSSIQIAIFVTPIIVILGWILDKSMSLYFNLFETATLFVSTFIVNFLVLDGRSNYLEGALLCACYVIIG